MEHVQGTQWWTDYQPVSYALSSKRGGRADFAHMVASCAAAGVGVVAGRSASPLSPLSNHADARVKTRC